MFCENQEAVESRTPGFGDVTIPGGSPQRALLHELPERRAIDRSTKRSIAARITRLPCPRFATQSSLILFEVIASYFRGTLGLDESGFRFSDEKAELTKILNNGNARGFPVLRTELVGRQEFDPRRSGHPSVRMLGSQPPLPPC